MRTNQPKSQQEERRSVNIALITIIVVSLAILLFITLGEHSGTLKYAYLFLFGLLSALCFMGLFLRKDLKENLLLVISSSLATLYFGEIYFSHIEAERTEKISRDLANSKWDYRTKFEVVRDMRGSGIDAWPVITPNSLYDDNGNNKLRNNLLPLAGISRKITVYCNESGSYTIYRSDKHGFNNPDRAYSQEIDLAVIGDSFAHGACVKPGEDPSSYLRNYGYSVLNFGMGSNGPLAELATLREYALPYKPKVVLWLYYEGNDLENLTIEKNNPILTSYLTNEIYSQNLVGRQHEIDRSLIDYADSEYNKKSNAGSTYTPNKYARLLTYAFELKWVKVAHFGNTLEKVSETLDALFFKRPESLQSEITLLESIIDKAKCQIVKSGATLYFVYIPERWRYDGRKYGDWRDRDLVIRKIRSMGVPIIDFSQFLDDTSQPLVFWPFQSRNHLSAEGYAQLAKLINLQLVNDGIPIRVPRR